MSRRVRTAVLAVHLIVSIGWIGALIGYLVLGMSARTSSDEVTVRGAWIGMELVGWYAIAPLAVASLATGIVMSLGTRWGLLDHYWVILSLALTASSVLVLLLHMPDVSATADVARTASPDQLATLGGDLGHPGIGLVILIGVFVLNIYKPRGLTGRGHRRRLASAELARAQ